MKSRFRNEPNFEKMQAFLVRMSRNSCLPRMPVAICSYGKDARRRHHAFDPDVRPLRAARVLRRAFGLSCSCTIVSLLIGSLLGWSLRHEYGPAAKSMETCGQLVSAGILLFATLANAGWVIHTAAGTTLVEKVNQWLTRGLFVFGTFFLSLFLSWA